MQQKLIADTSKRILYLLEDNKIVKKFKNIKFGLHGTTNEKVEGDGKTPLGTFPLGKAFGTKPIKTNYDYLLINENIYWVDDPSSQYYNQWVDVTKVNKDWQSAEHLIEYPIEYELGVVINYNIECQKGKGSAIFIHIASGETTHGCIAITKKNIKYLIKWLNSEYEPVIKII